MQKNSLYLILSLCSILMASCAKEGPTGPTGPAGPVFYGTISGHVKLYDMYGSEVLGGLSTASVTISTSSVPVTVSSGGAFSFINVATGSYILAASDSGYGATQKNNVNFVSGTLNEDMKLSAIPGNFLTGFTASHTTGSAYDSLQLTVTADTRARKCIVFVGNSNVNNLPGLYLIDYIINIPANTTSVGYAVPKQDLIDAGLASGGTVYYAAYSYVVGDVSVYEDVSTGQNTYNAVNDSDILQPTIVP